MTTRFRAVCALSIGFFQFATFANTLTWNGSVSTDFYNTNNWTPMTSPAAGDTLSINNNSAVNISPPFVSSGTMNWSGGVISGGLGIAGGGLLAISGGASKTLGASVTNSGTITVSGTGTLYFSANNIGIYNQPGALFDVQSNVTISSAGYTVLVTNAGTFRKSAGTNTTALTGVPFQNSGTVSALSGTLDLQNGGTLGGNWSAASGASLTFSGGAFTVLSNAVSSGAGFIGVAGGNPTFTGTLGTTMDWSGGAITSGGGGFNLATNGVLAISGGASKTLGESVTNSGTITVSGAGTLYFSANNIGIYNQPGALFDVQTNVTINSDGYTVLVTNAGTFRKSADMNTAALTGVPFQNSGTVSALSGTLDLQNGGTLGGNWSASSGASLTFSGGTFALLSNAVSSGPGFVGVAGGNPTFTGTLGTTMDWSGGAITSGGGGWTLTPGGVLAISGGASKTLGASVTNSGTITVSGTGTLYFSANNIGIYNQPGALFDVQSDVTINYNGYTVLVTNAGTFRKSAGTNTTALGGVPFQNSGTVSALSGTLDLQNGGTLGGNWSASSGASLTFSGGTFALLSSAVSSGAGFIGVAGGNPTFTGTLGTTMDWSGGNIGSGAGGWTLAGGGLLAVSGANGKVLSESVMNNGTITLAGAGTLYFNANNIWIYNQAGALFDVQSNVTITSGGFTVAVTNAGTFRKSAGMNTAALTGVPFQNSGTVSALSGTLDLQNGGTLGGNWSASSGASLTFSGGTFTILPSAVSSGPGFVGVAGGNPTFTGTLGTTMDWSGGNIGSGAGGWTLASGGLLAISGANGKFLSESVMNNGTITLAGAGTLNFNAPNIGIYNQAGALFDVQSDATISSGGFTVAVTNAGTFRKSAGTKTTALTGVPFQNSGTVSALSGTLDLQSGGTLGGNWSASSGASLTFSSGTFTVLSNAVSSGAGFIGVASSNPTFTGTLGTTMDWSGGNIGPGAGGWTLASGGLLAIGGANGKFLSESVTNFGTITLSGAGALSYNAVNVGIWTEPGALFDVQGDTGINNGGNSGSSLGNAGTFRKSAGTNTCAISGMTILNTGTWAALSGAFSDSSPFTNSGTLSLSLNGPTNVQAFSFTAGLKLGGALQAQVGNGFAPATNSNVRIISSSALSGNFATLNIPAGLSEFTSNNAVYLLALSAVPVQSFNPVYSAGSFTFSIGTASGQSYTIQRNDDLTTTNWVDVTNFTGNGLIQLIVMPFTNVPLRSFRVREP